MAEATDSGAPTPGDTPESQMQYYAEHAVPTALMDLWNKHLHISQAVDYYQGHYVTDDSNEIEQQAKDYLQDAVGVVVQRTSRASRRI